jgi:hypothetical protein
MFPNVGRRLGIVLRTANPFEKLSRRLRFLGQVLGFLCCAWIAVVGQALLVELTPDRLGNHRSPEVKERILACEGEFARRYACSDAILLSGERHGAGAVLARLGLTLMLPTIAWTMWRRVTAKAEHLIHH